MHSWVLLRQRVGAVMLYIQEITAPCPGVDDDEVVRVASPSRNS